MEEKIKLICRFYEQTGNEGKVQWLQLLSVKSPQIGKQVVEIQKKSNQYNPQIVFQDIKDIRSANFSLIEAMLNAYRFLLLDSKHQSKQYFDLAAQISKKMFINIEMLKLGVSEFYELPFIWKEQSGIGEYFDDVIGSNSMKIQNHEHYVQDSEKQHGIISRLETINEIALSGEKARAAELATIEFGDWINNLINRGIDFESSVFLMNLNHSYLVSLLERLNLFNLIDRYLQFLDQFMGSQPAIRDFIVRYYEEQQNQENIYLNTKKSLIVNPDQREKHQKLINLLTLGQFWSSALAEWKLYSEIFDLNQEEWMVYAKTACKALDLVSARTILQTLIESDYDSSKLSGLKGQIAHLEGNFDEAKLFLKDAVKFYPEEADSWVYLSKVYEIEGDIDNALSSLKSGIFASPDHADLYFNLARLYLSTESYSEALKHLRKAVVLNQYNPEYYYPLISTLQIVGLWEEAFDYLSFARREWPTEQKFAYLDAKRLLEEGKRKEAISVLKIATDGDPEKIPGAWYLLLVETILFDEKGGWLLADHNQITTEQLLISQKTLQSLLAQKEKENSPVIKVFLAEVYFLLEENVRSKTLFEEIFSENKSNIHHTDFGWRVFAGLGMVRTFDKQYEEALVLIGQASKLNPSNMALKRKLADVYYLANLPEEALKIAYEIFNLRRDDLNSILWFADLARKINRPLERIEALEQALQFTKHNANINNQLAVEYILQGKEDEAVRVLEGISQDHEAAFCDFRIAVTTYLRIDKLKEALDFFKIGLDRVSGKINLEMKTELIYLYFLNKDWEQVLALVTSEDFEGYDYMAYHVIQAHAYQNLNQREASITSLNQALELKSGLGDRLYDQSETPVFIPETWIRDFENKKLINQELINLWVYEKELNKAITVIENQISEKTVEGFNYFQIIELLIRTNNFDAAFRKLEEAKKYQMFSEQDKELRFAYELFLTYMLKKPIPEMEYIQNQNFVLAQVMNAFVYLNEHQVTVGSNHYQIALDEIKQKQVFSSIPKKFGINQFNTTILFRLLLICANQINDYNSLEMFFDQMKLSEVFENELPYYQVIINFSYRGYEWLFGNLEAEKNRNNIQYPLSSENAVEVSLLPLVEKIPNSELCYSLEQILSGFEAKSTSELELIYGEKIPELAGILILELLKREEIALVDKLLIQQPDFLGSMIYAANIVGDYPLEAKLVLDRLPDYDDPVFLFLKGLVNFENKLINVAIVDLRKAILLWDDQLRWKLKLADLLTQSGQAEEACGLWQELLDQTSFQKDEILIPFLNLLINSNQITEAERILSLYQNDLSEKFETYFLMVKIYYKSGKFEKALEACKRAEHFDKNNPDLDFWKAKVYYKLGQFEKSAQFAKSFVNIHPEDIDATKLLISSNKRAGKLDDTIRLIDLALVHIPVELAFKLEKLDVLIDLGRYDDAAKYSAELKETFYDHPEFNAKVADLYMRMGDFHAAEHAAKAAIRNSEQGFPELRTMLAQILADQGQFDQALHYLGEAAAMDVENAKPCFEMGKIYYRIKDFQQALISYQEAIKRDRDEPQAYYEAGIIMREIKDYQGAEKMLRIASELNPKDTNIRRQLAGVVALNFVHTPAEVK
jgi:tetratricopeptide (TPR) repeat protein